MREAAPALMVGEGLDVSVGPNVGVCPVGWRALAARPTRPSRKSSVTPTPNVRS
jgi:hypothetical protein